MSGIAKLEGDSIVLPGIASAHSHAFQRALRGRTHRRSGSFFSWRGLMYELAERLTPEDVYAISRFAYIELLKAGVTAVGEFHYLHHQPDGTPYERRTELADAVVRAALDAGIRVSLLRVLYHRPGFGRAAEGAQRRFSDPSVDDALRDVATLLERYEDEPLVRVGVAPHSVRAVPRPWLSAAAAFSDERSLPLHMHVGEQRREVQEALAEHGLRPVALLDDSGLLSPRFVAVHATHLDRHEIRQLGAAASFVCLCRTTERDLGDGPPPLSPLLERGARLSFGVDSHALSDPFEEARAAELDERTRTEKRCLVEASTLIAGMTHTGYAAIGMADLASEDRVELCARTAELAGLTAPLLDDAVVFSASARSVRDVFVDGRAVVEDGHHEGEERARRAFDETLTRLGLAPL